MSRIFDMLDKDLEARDAAMCLLEEQESLMGQNDFMVSVIWEGVVDRNLFTVEEGFSFYKRSFYFDDTELELLMETEGGCLDWYIFRNGTPLSQEGAVAFLNRVLSWLTS